MSRNNIDFVTYCIGNLARRLEMSASEVYRLLKQSGILMEYIVPSYDVLHTFGKEYLMEDLTEYMKEKGVLVPPFPQTLLKVADVNKNYKL